ncbi:hypothetical protein ES705_26083 [subsurface metagenome]
MRSKEEGANIVITPFQGSGFDNLSPAFSSRFPCPLLPNFFTERILCSFLRKRNHFWFHPCCLALMGWAGKYFCLETEISPPKISPNILYCYTFSPSQSHRPEVFPLLPENAPWGNHGNNPDVVLFSCACFFHKLPSGNSFCLQCSFPERGSLSRFLFGVSGFFRSRINSLFFSHSSFLQLAGSCDCRSICFPLDFLFLRQKKTNFFPSFHSHFPGGLHHL